MFLIDQYLLTHFIRVFFITLFVTMLIPLAIAQDGQLITLVTEGVLLPSEILLMIYYPLAQFIDTCLIFALSISVIIYVNFLCQNNRGIILLSSGNGIYRITAYITVFAALISVAMFFFNATYAHKAYDKYYSLLYELRERAAKNFITKKTFLKPKGGYIFYAKETNKAKGTINGIFVSYFPKDDKNKYIAMAKDAIFGQSNDQSSLTLKNGVQFLYSNENTGKTALKITFDELHPDIEDRIKLNFKAPKRTSILTIPELKERYAEDSRAAQFLHRRLAGPLIPVGLCAMLILLFKFLNGNTRKTYRLKMLLATLLTIGFVALHILSTNLASPALVYLTPFLGWFILIAIDVTSYWRFGLINRRAIKL